MNIIFVVNELSKRGAQQQLLSLVKKLCNHANVSVFSFSNDDDVFPEFSKYDGVKIYFNKHLGKYNILKAKSLSDCLLRGHYDALITVGLGTALFLGRALGILHNISIIYSTLHTFHNLNKNGDQYFETFNRILNAFFESIPSTKIFKFLPVCGELSKKVRSLVKNYRVETLFNGIPKEDIDKIPAHEPSGKTKAILAQIAGFPTVVQVGTLDWNKNQIYTMNCIKDIREYVPDIRLLIIGVGEGKNELQTWVKQNNLMNHIIFASQVSRMDCIYLMSHSDVLVLTSYSEGFPNVLIEGQALGLPVVSFNVGGVSDIILHGITGYLIEQGRQELFPENLIMLLTDQNLARKMGSKGKQRVLENFTIDKKVTKFVSMLEKDLFQLREKF